VDKEAMDISSKSTMFSEIEALLAWFEHQ